MIASEEVLYRLAARKSSNDAQQRIARVQIMMSPQWQQDMASRLNSVLIEASSVRVKLRKIYALVDLAHEKRADQAACKQGCDACCHMQVEMPDIEADLIAAKIGRPAAKLRPGRHTTPIRDLGRPDTPCSFLVDRRCSIYEVRPFVCRDLAVLDIDALTCGFENMELERLGDKRAVAVPQSTVTPLKNAFVQLTAKASSAWADIRQFFPGPQAK